MADPVAPAIPAPLAPAAVAAPIVAPAVTPAAAAPVTPAAVTVPSPAPIASDGAAPITPVEPVAPVVVAPTTVLGDALKPAETPKAPVAAEAAPVEPTKPEGQSAEPAPPPVFDTFKLPEGITFDAERVGKFASILGEYETSAKADHAKVQELGQKLVDYHLATVQEGQERLRQSIRAADDKQKLDWKEQFLNNPDFGGNRFQTTVDSALTFIRTHGGTDAEQSEFRALMDSSGLGNNLVMIRLLARAGGAMSEGRPLAATVPPSVPKSKTEVMYGKGARK